MKTQSRLWSVMIASLAVIVGVASTAAATDPGVGVVDPGLNQPGVVGNAGGVARRSMRR